MDTPAACLPTTITPDLFHEMGRSIHHTTMNTSDIMKNPAFAPILFEIERRILASVRSAKADGIDLNDSQIRSMLNKVRKAAEGGKPQLPEASPRDKALAGLYRDLIEARKGIQMEDSAGQREALPTRLWTLCLQTIEDSIQRYSTGPGSRGYQDFLEGFIAKAGKTIT
jgi:hypothetical protein